MKLFDYGCHTRIVIFNNKKVEVLKKVGFETKWLWAQTFETLKSKRTYVYDITFFKNGEIIFPTKAIFCWALPVIFVLGPLVLLENLLGFFRKKTD